MSLFSQDSFPIMMSGLELSTRFSNSCFLFLTDWQLMITTLSGLSSRLTFDLLGVLSKGEDAAVGLPKLPSLIGVPLKMSNLFVASKLVVSNKLMKILVVHISRNTMRCCAGLCMRGCAYPYIPCDTKTLQESQHTAGVVHVTALLHIPHGYLGVLGPGFGSGAYE